MGKFATKINLINFNGIKLYIYVCEMYIYSKYNRNKIEINC
jgi:hypothetical protein